MEYFTTALHHGSIANAAADLNIAASAVSNAIDQVGAEFDLSLVSRQRARGIQPTASGRDVAHKCQRLLEDCYSLLVDGKELKQSQTGVLRIGYYAPIAPAFLPQVFDTFLAKGSGATLHLEECNNDEAQDGLLKGIYDAILIVAEDVRPPIAYDVLIEAPPYCMLARSHPLAKQAAVTMTQIAQEPSLVLNRPVVGPYYQGLFDGNMQQNSIVTYANSTEMVRSLVASGHGVAILNMRPLPSETHCGARRRASDCRYLPPLTLVVGYDKNGLDGSSRISVTHA